MQDVTGPASLQWIRSIACRSTLACLLFFALLFLIPSAFAEYQLERLWPSLQQDWGFEETRDIDHDAQGNIYLLELFNAAVVKQTSDGRAVTEWSSPDPPDPQLTAPGRIAIDRVNSVVYVLDGGSGPPGTGIVFRFDLDGQYLSSFDASAPGTITSILVDDDGSVLVGYEAPNGTADVLVRYDANGTVLASWDATTLGVPTPIASVGFRMSRNGNNLYVLLGNTVYPFSIADTVTLTPQTSWPAASNDTPEDIAIDPAGKVWVAGISTGSNIQLVRYTPTGTLEAAHTLARQITTVRGVTILPGGNIYIASGASPDPQVGEVDVIAPDGTPLNLWTAQGTGNGSFQDAPDVTIAANGDVYVLDVGNNLVQIFDNNGIYQSQWAIDPSGTTPDGISKLFVDGDIFIWNPEVSLDRYNSAGVYQGAWQPASPPANFDIVFIQDAIVTNGRVYLLQNTQGGGGGGGNNPDFTLWVFDQAGVLEHEYGLEDQALDTDKFQTARLLTVDGSQDVFVGIRHAQQPLRGLYHYAVVSGAYAFVELIAMPGSPSIPFADVTDLDVASDGTYLLSYSNDQNQSGTGRMLLHLDTDGTVLQSFSRYGSEPGELALDIHQLLETENGWAAGIALDSTDRLFVADAGNRRIQVFEPAIQSNRTKAIIVAGGGPYSGNNLWGATQAMSNAAYRTLGYKGFTRDSIQYLSASYNPNASPNSLIGRIDADANKANLQDALVNWALADNDGIPGPDATDVVLYVTDHGGVGSMRISGTETVSDTELDGWLDTVEAAISGRVTLVYDACHAGSFTSIADPDRILLLSSASNQVSYFTGRGILSYSQFFWSKVFAGGSLSDAFVAAQNGIANTPTAQDPELDADGDGVPNEQVDDLDALQNIYIGNGVDLFQAGPSIGSISAPQSIPASTATITATNVTDSDHRVNRVWATVYPPDLPPPDPDNPVVDLPTFELEETAVGSGNYNGTYDNFTSVGIYQVIVTAQDVPGNTSAPQLTTVTVGTPLARRAVLVVGGDPADASTWPAYEASGTTAYNALRAQGYTDTEITYLSGTIVNTVEQPVTLANLQTALTDTGVLNNTQDLVLYMVGPGDGLNFTLNPGETLPTGTLDGWTDDLVKAIPGKLTLVMDAGSAGIYLGRLSAPAGREEGLYRVASTIGGTAHFQGNGSVSFTTFFAGNIANGATLNTAYKLAKLAMQAASNNQQQAWLDTNSDNTSDKFDGGRVVNFSLGPGILLAGDEPIIGNAGIDGFSPSADPMDVTLWASNITTTGTLSEVWALVTPPDIDGFGGADPVPERVDMVFNSLLLRYEAQYILPSPLGGGYSVNFYAKDKDGAVSLPWTETLTREDIFEPDDAEARASAIIVDDPAQYHSFHTVNDEDWVTFDVTLNAGDPPVTLTITADPVGTQADVVLDITEPNNNVVHVDQNLAGEFPEGTETYVLTVSTVGTHTYRMKVSLDTRLPNTPSDYFLAITRGIGGNPTTTISGQVTDTNGDPVFFAQVKVAGTGATTGSTSVPSSPSLGEYIMAENAGTYILTAQKIGYFMDADGDGNPDPDLGTIMIPATGETITNIILTPDIPPDADGDGIPDASDPYPNNVDGDGDGLCDGPNTVAGVCVAGEDLNANGVVDSGETDPTNPDTDGDGFNDGDEVYFGSDPLNQADTPANGDINEDGVVNAADMLLATRIVMGQYTPSADERVRADVAPFNGIYPVPDGLINAGDLVRIQRMAVELP